MLKTVVHAADVSDRDGARLVLNAITQQYPTLRHLWVDAGYQGSAVTWIEKTLELSVTVVRMPRRWVVERTFAWLGRYRRLSKDYEALPATEEAWIHLAMSSLMLARLAQ